MPNPSQPASPATTAVTATHSEIAAAFALWHRRNCDLPGEEGARNQATFLAMSEAERAASNARYLVELLAEVRGAA